MRNTCCGYDGELNISCRSGYPRSLTEGHVWALKVQWPKSSWSRTAINWSLGTYIEWHASENREPTPTDGGIGQTRWTYSTSTGHGSQIIRSNLALFEVIFLTYDLLRQVPAHVTCVEYKLQNDHRWLNAVLSRGHIGLHGNFFRDHCWVK